MKKNILLGIILVFYSITGLSQNSDVLSYGTPEEVGLDSELIHQRVDSIITNGIEQEAFPGAQVLVAKNGKIIFHEARNQNLAETQGH